MSESQDDIVIKYFLTKPIFKCMMGGPCITIYVPLPDPHSSLKVRINFPDVCRSNSFVSNRFEETAYTGILAHLFD